MIVAAHPDDELLGLGATMHKLIHTQNVTAHVVILGEGITSRADSRDVKACDSNLKTHRQNMKNAAEKIGYQSESFYNFADNRFDSHDLLDIVKVIEKEKNNFQPNFIFTHHKGDLNIDHQVTFQAVMTACRPMDTENVKGIISFETPSATEWQANSDPRKFSPNLYMEICHIDLVAKCEAMEEYEFEKRKFPHPRSSKALEILASYRGMTIGKPLAEAFEIIRLIS